MHNNPYTSSSRRKTPWDDKDTLSPTQVFIRDKYLNEYYSNHPKLSDTSEAVFLNSFDMRCCKHCGSIDFIKRGHTSNGIQRYRCNDCKKTFTILTNTLFENHKISILEWIEYLLNLFGYVSFSSTSRNSRIAVSTNKFWLIKVFELLKDYQSDTVLSNEVWIDETFYRVIKKDRTSKACDGENRYCIGIGYDRNKVYVKIQGLSTSTSYKWTKECFIDHILPGSTLIHDLERSHDILVRNLNLNSRSYSSVECKAMDSSKNPLTPINNMCSLLKQFLNAHRGFDRDDLQDYLNLFAFIMNPPHDRLEKIEYLINCGVYSAKTIKYREIFSKNN